jgi:hypothetical protein
MTGLDTQLDVFISLMNRAFYRRWSSDAIALHFGSSNLRRGCFTGRALGSTFSACSTSSLGTPGMSNGHHAKISQRSRWNLMSALSYAGSKSTAIDVVLSGSVGWTQTFFESRVVSKAWSGRDQPMSGNTLGSVSPLSLAYSTVMQKVCAIWWNSLSHMSETSKFHLTVMTLFCPGIFSTRYA